MQIMGCDMIEDEDWLQNKWLVQARGGSPFGKATHSWLENLP